MKVSHRRDKGDPMIPNSFGLRKFLHLYCRSNNFHRLPRIKKAPSPMTRGFMPYPEPYPSRPGPLPDPSVRVSYQIPPRLSRNLSAPHRIQAAAIRENSSTDNVSALLFLSIPLSLNILPTVSSGRPILRRLFQRVFLLRANAVRTIFANTASPRSWGSLRMEIRRTDETTSGTG